MKLMAQIRKLKHVPASDPRWKALIKKYGQLAISAIFLAQRKELKK